MNSPDRIRSIMIAIAEAQAQLDAAEPDLPGWEAEARLRLLRREVGALTDELPGPRGRTVPEEVATLPSPETIGSPGTGSVAEAEAVAVTA